MVQKKVQTAEFGLGTVAAAGLLFKGRIYSNAEMVKQQWFDKAQKDGEWVVPVLYMESEPDRIILLDLKGVEMAFVIEKPRKPDSEIDEAFYEAMNNLKKQLGLQSRWLKKRH